MSPPPNYEKEIKKIMKYGYYGIRTQDFPFEEVGETMIHESVIWINGKETEESLNGVCALDMRRYASREEAIQASKLYFGDYVAIIASDSMTYGEDENEIILRDPTVIEIIK